MNKFNGFNKDKIFYDGLYIKNEHNNLPIAFIPAFHIDDLGVKSASIQVITDSFSYNFKFFIEDFSVNKKDFYMKIGKNIFAQDGILIDLENENIKIKAKLYFDNISFLNYDVMGPFKNVKNLKCNHGIFSYSHSVTGEVNINNEKFIFDDNIGYIEKGWGESFPDTYIWSQCNKLQDKNFFIMVAMAKIKYWGLLFNGSLATIMYDGKEYRLASYLGCKVKNYGRYGVVLKQGKYILKIKFLNGAPQKLLAPQNGDMTREIEESIKCRVKYELFENSKLIFRIIADNASYEYSSIYDC
ncbi:MAG: tocopherol cyclase family protein [Oscillospiraceae bacterium]